MKFGYKFSNLLGTVYKEGNLVFTNDGNSLISPVGNRITIYDLKVNKSLTLPVESRYNYTSLSLSPDGCILIAVNEEGEAHLISLVSQTIVQRYRFKKRVNAVKFSPDSKHFAVCKENNVFIFKTPGVYSGEFNSFVMERVFHGAYDETTCLDWSSDSNILAVGSKDTSTRLYTLNKYENFKSYSLGSHTDGIVACFFEDKSYDITTISKNGQACVWECNFESNSLVALNEQPLQKKQRDDIDSEDDIYVENAAENTNKVCKEKSSKMNFKRLTRHYLTDSLKKENISVTLTSAAYHRETKILITGYSTGDFFLHELPEVNLIHSLSISENTINAISINITGDWIALGCSSLGQLLVWEWQSETYVMKQQGHANNMSCVAYSADGQYIVTGGHDGKLKLWNVHSGFCYITFNEHSAPVTGVACCANKKFIVSCSLDGTVRAYDIIRYRNFRTMTCPRPTQFSCVAVDISGEFIAAGGQDVFDIFLWSVKMGQLLEILSGHTGPICSLIFNPNKMSSALASVSWDKTLKLWNALEHGSQHETLELCSDGLCVAYKPNGEEVAVATLDGQISVFHVRTATQTTTIEGRNDLGAGRSETDLITAKQILKARSFTTICYSADGEYILAGGQSKNVCIYNVKEGMLVKKFEITQNRSLDGLDDIINRRKMTEFGNIALLEKRESNEGGNVMIKLPGVKKIDVGLRDMKPEVRVFALQFSPTGEAWAVATTEGLLVYSLKQNVVFDPWNVNVSITPNSVKETFAKEDYAKALMMALNLNETHIIQEVVERICPKYINSTIDSIPETYINRLLKYIISTIESSRHLEFYLHWIFIILNRHSTLVLSTTLIALHRILQHKYETLAKICDFNKYTMNYILMQAESLRLKKIKQEIVDDDPNSVDDMSMLIN